MLVRSEIEVDGVQLLLIGGEAGLRSIWFHPGDRSELPLDAAYPLLCEAERQLRKYFAGELRTFSLPLDIQGTEFQKRVWRELETIPYGETRSYMQIAVALGAPHAVRAVGAANGANPLPIVVPCHRVIGAGGKLVGYGGGLNLKRRLLAIEQGGWLPGAS